MRSGRSKTLVFPRKNALEARVGIGLEPAVELPALMGIDQTDRDSLEKIRFGGQIGAAHRKS